MRFTLKLLCKIIYSHEIGGVKNHQLYNVI